MDEDKAKKITEAFNLLESNGIYMSVPGWFELSDAEDAVEFVSDNFTFYERRNPDFSRG